MLQLMQYDKTVVKVRCQRNEREREILHWDYSRFTQLSVQ